MKLQFLSMHYRPEPCDTRTSVLASEMSKRGHECTVLTSFPNYPFGRVYDGYRQRLVQRSIEEGVEVVRVPMFPDHSHSVKRRALSYLSFAASAGVVGPVATGRPDLLWIHHPPLTTGLAGWWLSRLKRVPFVYEIHDLWPETLMSSGMVEESLATRSIRRVCEFLHRRAAAVIVTSEGMKSHLVAQGLSEERVHVVPQWAEESSLPRVVRDAEFGASHGMSGKFNVVFTGNVGVAQDIDTILGAAQVLTSREDIRFTIVGAGVELDRLRAKAHRMKNVRFVGQVDRSELPQFFAWSDALLVTLKRDPLFEITVPSKTQTYLHAGRPILCGVAGDTAKIVEDAGAGLVLAPEDDVALARAILRMQQMPAEVRETIGDNAARAYADRFSIHQSVETYERLFSAVLDRPCLRVVPDRNPEEQREAA